MYVGDQSQLLYTDYLLVDRESLLVKLMKSFDRELDSSVTVTYWCHDASNVTSSCHANVVIDDVNDQSPYIQFSNSTTAKYDRLSAIEITARQVR